MSNILLVISSPRGEASHSTEVANALVDQLGADDPNAVVTVRDLAREPLPHIGEDFVVGMATLPASRTEAQQVAVARSDALIDALLAADTVVIASAMINFGPSSTLKSWIDHITRAGRTFRAADPGTPEGLATGKKVYLVEARGGVYADGSRQAHDFQEPYLPALLGFIGMTDIETITVDGVAFGPEMAAKAVAAALDQVSTISARAA